MKSSKNRITCHAILMRQSINFSVCSFKTRAHRLRKGHWGLRGEGLAKISTLNIICLFAIFFLRLFCCWGRCLLHGFRCSDWSRCWRFSSKTSTSRSETFFLLLSSIGLLLLFPCCFFFLFLLNTFVHLVMEVNQTTTDVIYLFLLEGELFKLCIHLDITDCEQVLFLSAVSFHVPLNHDSSIVFFLRFVHFHQTQLIHSLYHKYCLFSSSEYFHELSSATDSSPATLKTQNGIHYTFL